MTSAQIAIFAILAATVAAFLWGRFRHDTVALAALMAGVLAGVVPAAGAFAGFGHPAVITVACVLILSRALQRTGAVDALARRVLPAKAGRLGTLAALMGLGALLSAFMNNVGAMALLTPLAVQLAAKQGLPPGQVLMPLAFGTILGGMTTLVGTPPNLIVAGFRAEAAFGMFDFAWVGLPVALLGVAFVALVGWRLVPVRRPAGDSAFETGVYLAELRVAEGSDAIGQTLRQFEDSLDAAALQVVGLVRAGARYHAPHGGRQLREGDILLVEADAKSLAEEAVRHGLVHEGLGNETGKEGAGKDKTGKDRVGKEKTGKNETGKHGADDPDSGDVEVALREMTVLPGSAVIGRSARQMRLRSRHGIALLAVSRMGAQSGARLATLVLKAGDLLLLRGTAEDLADFARDMACAPLDTEALTPPDRQKGWIAAGIMAIAVLLAAFGVLPAPVAFALGVVVTMAAGTLPLREVYTAIDWPVVVLLAALIPVAGAMQSTGAADLLARVLVDGLAQGNALVALTVVLVVTMFLSDVMNNAATAAVMAPIAIGIAATLGVGADGFLMAVAIGASCAFLTPIGHQNNTLILGPGGFQFGDYWRLGLLLEAIIVAVSVPLIWVVWGV